MKPVFFSAALLALFAAATTSQARTLAAAPTDTIVVRLPNKATMTLVVRDAQQLRELKKYQLDSLTSRLATYITQAETAAKAGATDQVTMRFYPDQDQPGQNLPAEVRITARKPSPGATESTSKTQVFLNRKFGVTRTTDEDGSSAYHVGKNATKKPAADSIQHGRRQPRASVKLIYDLGLNTFVNASSGGSAGVPATDVFSWSGLYTNVGLNYVQPLHFTKHSKLALTFGPEFAFNNFRLQSSNQWVQSGSQTYTMPTPTGQQVEKSRLYVSTLNLPVMLRFKLLNKAGKRTLSAGAGAFGGYRLGSNINTEYKLAGDDNKYENTTSGQLNLNNWQYGLQGDIGFSALRIFAKYNLNELFREGQGPKTHMFSFGLRLSGF